LIDTGLLGGVNGLRGIKHTWFREMRVCTWLRLIVALDELNTLRVSPVPSKVVGLE
jgi:hypothetical protein